jgi:PKD repeat protein
MKYKILNNTGIFILITGLLIFQGCEDKEMGNPLPSTVADFSYTSDNEFVAPTSISFSNESILAQSYAWEFGNGATSSDANPTYTFQDPGVYQVKLTVTPANDVHYNELEKAVSLVIKDPLVATTKRLYYTDRNTGTAHFVYLDGKDPIIQDFQGGGFYKPYGITVSNTNQKVYISDTDGFIYAFNLDGGAQEFVLKEEDNPLATEPYGIVTMGDEIYWATYGLEGGGVAKAALDGSEPASVAQFSAAPELPLGMAYDSIQDKIYFVNDKYDFSGGIWSINPDGSGLQEVLPGVDAGAIALDLENGRMYYADWVGGVFSANLDGTDVLNIYPDLDGIFVWGIAVNPEEGKVYVSDKTNLKIIRMNLDGSESEDWITGVEPYAMFIYDPLQ